MEVGIIGDKEVTVASAEAGPVWFQHMTRHLVKIEKRGKEVVPKVIAENP